MKNSKMKGLRKIAGIVSFIFALLSQNASAMMPKIMKVTRRAATHTSLPKFQNSALFHTHSSEHLLPQSLANRVKQIDNHSQFIQLARYHVQTHAGESTNALVVSHEGEALRTLTQVPKVRALLQAFAPIPKGDIKYSEDYRVAGKGTGEIIDGSIIEGSVKAGGVTPDLVMDLNSPFLKRLKEKAADLHSKDIEPKTKVNLIKALVLSALSQPSYEDPQLKETQALGRTQVVERLSIAAATSMGDCRPHAYIFAALLREAGISAKFINLHVTHQKKVGGQWTEPVKENHTVVVAELGGSQYILDSYLDHFHSKPYEQCASKAGYEDENSKIKIEYVNPFPIVYHPVTKVVFASEDGPAIVRRTDKEFPANLSQEVMAPSSAIANSAK